MKVHVNGVLDVPLPSSKLGRRRTEDHLGIIDDDEAEQRGASPCDPRLFGDVGENPAL